jgi:hypothetical protein
MAAFNPSPTWSGVQLELSHDEIETVTDAQDINQALRSIAPGLSPSYDGAFAVASRYFATQAQLVKELDQGNGVSLTIPWSAVWWGQWWLVVPNTR